MSGPEHNGQDGRVVTRTRVEKKTRLRRPPMYKVLFHNDDYTPFGFVLAMMMQIFHMNETEAMAKTRNVEKQGVGVVGVYPFSVAETKVAETLAEAEKAGFPLMATFEPESDADDATDG